MRIYYINSFSDFIDKEFDLVGLIFTIQITMIVFAMEFINSHKESNTATLNEFWEKVLHIKLSIILSIILFGISLLNTFVNNSILLFYIFVLLLISITVLFVTNIINYVDIITKDSIFTEEFCFFIKGKIEKGEQAYNLITSDLIKQINFKKTVSQHEYKIVKVLLTNKTVSKLYFEKLYDRVNNESCNCLNNILDYCKNILINYKKELNTNDKILLIRTIEILFINVLKDNTYSGVELGDKFGTEVLHIFYDQNDNKVTRELLSISATLFMHAYKYKKREFVYYSLIDSMYFKFLEENTKDYYIKLEFFVAILNVIFYNNDTNKDDKLVMIIIETLQNLYFTSEENFLKLYKKMTQQGTIYDKGVKNYTAYFEIPEHEHMSKVFTPYDPMNAINLLKENTN